MSHLDASHGPDLDPHGDEAAADAAGREGALVEAVGHPAAHQRAQEARAATCTRTAPGVGLTQRLPD